LYSRCLASSALDRCVNFGATGSKASKINASADGLVQVADLIFPMVIYTGQAFTSLEKLVNWVPSDV
jgi:hypothetical protein